MSDRRHHPEVQQRRALVVAVGVNVGVTAAWVALELAYRWRRFRALVS